MGGGIAVAGREVDLVLLVALTGASSDSCTGVGVSVSGPEVNSVLLAALARVSFASRPGVDVVDSDPFADADTASREVDFVLLVALVGASFTS